MTGRPVSEPKATTRMSAPSSARTLSVTRSAISSRAPSSSSADVVLLGALAQDRQARGGVGRADVGDEAGLEALAQARLHVVEVAREAVGGEDDLGAGLVERVEGVEELLLRADLGLEELDVVDEQDVDAAVGGLEGVRVAAVDGADEVVGERLGGGVADGRAGAVGRDVVRDRVQEVRLAEAGRAADEERVVGEAGHLGDGERGGVREAVGVADDELLEGLAGVEGRLGRSRRSCAGAPAPAWERLRPVVALLGRGLPPGGRPRRSRSVPARPVRCLRAGRRARRGRQRPAPPRCRPAAAGRSGRRSSAGSRPAPRSAARRSPGRAVSGSSHWCQVESGTARSQLGADQSPGR